VSCAIRLDSNNASGYLPIINMLPISYIWYMYTIYIYPIK
jgi:hypothetical protein